MRALKSFVFLALTVAAVDRAPAFSVFGPAETYQVPTLDYVTRYYYNDTEMGGPKTANQGARLNTGVVTYGFDYTFLSFFGARGVAAVDNAMAQLNALPRASSINLNKYLMQGNQVVNYSAQALSVTDLKSTVMSLMLEHMGLNGETHVWDLLGRVQQTPAAGVTSCDFQYTYLNHNYDPVTYNPSAYVNGIQYGFKISDDCPLTPAVADAIEITTDETSPALWDFTAVATRQSLRVGGYFLGLTYDDVGGLKYLYNQHRFEQEGLESNVVAEPTLGTYIAVDTLLTNNTAFLTNLVLGGVEKVQYVKMVANSIIGVGYQPRTFSYTLPWANNGQISSLRVTRTVFEPDIIFAAGDLTANNTGTGTISYSVYPEGYNRTFGFISNGFIGFGNSGTTAQVISPEETITFNDETPAGITATGEGLVFLGQEYPGEYPILQWGSFDGSTNAPFIFPDNSSTAALEAQILSGAGQITPSSTYNPAIGVIVTNITGTSGTGGTTGTTP